MTPSKIVILIAVLIIAFSIFAYAISKSSKRSGGNHSGRAHSSWLSRLFESPQRRYGRKGEEKASDIIRSVMTDDDRLFTNVEISYENRDTELDNVIVNSYGVFIIEVKSYKGLLVGNEDDPEWNKFHTTDAGKIYPKTVRNPIPQVKRQIYILSNYLRYNSAPRVWIEGYAFFVNGNSPVTSRYILSDARDIESAIHTPQRSRLSPSQVDRISALLS